MKVQILSREIIKPSSPTSPSLRDYKISLLDELAPLMNIPLILYYPTNEKCNIISKSQHLKKSLAKALTDFYPLAGRYVKESHMVDCSDQGAEFVEAHADGHLSELLGQGRNLKTQILNAFVPLPIGAADEITDPLLAVQFNIFDCGGVAIGLSISHRVADMSTISTFIHGWTNAAREEEIVDPISPSFYTASFFPGKGVPPLSFELSRTKEDSEVHKIVTKIFSFSKKSISRIRDKNKPQDSSKTMPSKVQTVCAVIGKAIIDVGVAIQGYPRDFLVIQAVNMREKTVPRMPKNQCGNLFTIALFRSVASERGVEFQDLVDMLNNSIKRVVDMCGKILSNGEDEQMVLTNPIVELGECFSNPKVFVSGGFSSWCRFSLYEVDFGWGNPIWVGVVNMPIKNNVVLIDDKSGEEIEAWVSLDENDMREFEQDCNIREFTT